MVYLTFPQIDAAMTAMQSLAPAGVCTKIALPNPTVSEGGIGPTTYSYLKIGNGSGPGRPAVLAVAGMHAREWAQPDAVISFGRKLLAAYATGSAFVIPAYTDREGNTHGPVSVPESRVQAMVDRLDILLVPCVNPDGRKYSQSARAHHMWRKTRAPRPAGGADASVGVDANRNYDIAWDFDVYYTPAFLATNKLYSSKDPESDLFIGKPAAAPGNTHPAMEPESKNLVWILDHHPVTWVIDLHAFSKLLMYPWSIEQNGVTSTQNFHNPAHDGARDGVPGTAYKEFFPNAAPTWLLRRHEVIAGSMRDRVIAATGRKYRVGPGAKIIYPASGTFSDFVFSRQFTIAGSPPIHAFAAEFGSAGDGFQPSPNSRHGYARVERELHAVLLALLEAAVPPKPPPAPTPPSASTPKPASPGSSSTCLMVLASVALVDGGRRVDTLRRGRSQLLAGRVTGRPGHWVDLGYRRVSRALAPRVARSPRLRRLVALAVLTPASAIVSRVMEWRSP
jgi:hypothetical protein